MSSCDTIDIVIKYRYVNWAQIDVFVIMQTSTVEQWQTPKKRPANGPQRFCKIIAAFYSLSVLL